MAEERHEGKDRIHTEEYSKSDLNFLERLVKANAEIAITTQTDGGTGWAHHINYTEGNLEIHPVIIQDPITDRPYISQTTKYVAVGLFKPGMHYTVLEFDNGYLERLVRAKGIRKDVGFNQTQEPPKPTTE